MFSISIDISFSRETHHCVHYQGLEGRLSSSSHFKILILTRRNPGTQNNNGEQIYTLESGHNCVPLEKLMPIDTLNIN